MKLKKSLPVIGLANTFTQLTLFSSIFTFTSNLGGIRALFEHSLAVILFPLAIAPDAIATALSFLGFYLTLNRNAGALFDLIHGALKTALVFTAVFANLPLIAVNGIFIGVLGFGVLYHASLVIYNGYQWFKIRNLFPTLATEARKNTYKQNVINNSLAVAIGIIAIVAIVVTMLFVSVLSEALVAAVGIGAAVSLPILGGLLIYQSLFSPQKTNFSNAYAAQLAFKGKTDSQESLLGNGANQNEYSSSTNSFITRPSPDPDANNYYYKDFQSYENKNSLKEKIKRKSEQLLIQIINSKKTWWGRLQEKVWPEGKKRLAKIKYLEELDLILDKNFNAPEMINDVNPMYCQQCGAKRITDDPHGVKRDVPPGAFQSFFRKVSETENLGDAVLQFIETQKTQVGTPHYFSPSSY